MATYISLVQFTDKGIHAAKETTQRVAEWAAKVQSPALRSTRCTGHSVTTTRYVSSRHQTTKRLPAYYCPRTCWATFGRRRCALLRASRWKRFSPIFRNLDAP